MALQHLRSSTLDKRPTPGAMSDGQLALNTNLTSPGLFFKDSNGDSVKIGPVHVGTTAPNATPGAGGQAGNSKGEAWLDTTATNPILKVWNGSAFVAVQPVGTGTVVSTTDTGTVTSTMILDGTIVNADINASAAIAFSKLANVSATDRLLGRSTAGAGAIEEVTCTAAGRALIDDADAAAQRTTLGVVIGTDVQAYDADTAKTDVVQSFTAGQRGSITALTDGATITVDFADSEQLFGHSVGGNRTLANPSNQTAGQAGTIVVTQDGTGSRTMAFGSNWKFPGGTAPTLTTAASSVDVIAYYVESATRITARLISDVK
jgi:hypothetical protein